jgi:class 3 adenylate cyclase
VHTIGDCYVVMGYTGKVSKYRRSESTQVEEAYRVMQVAFEMIEIIKNVRENSVDPNLKNLDMRIGIHTGKIVGGIIGTKVVRYDIFGNDVLIANKMESNGVDSQVIISESTFNLLNRNQSIMDSLDFTPHKDIEFPTLNRTV